MAANAKGIPDAGFGPGLRDGDAECAKFKLAARLPKHLGALSGYKLGFVSKASRQAHDTDQARWGFMYERNLIDIIAVIAVNFGAYPGFDANLMVEVRDAELADAATPLQALQHLESIMPFIELSDLMVPGSLTANDLVATNLSFRGGIKGVEVPVQATQEFADALAAFSDSMVDESRDHLILGSARGDVLMGHSLSAAVWLAKALKQAGIALKAGDLLSLLLRPCKVLSGIANPTVLEVAHNSLRCFLQHRHMLLGSLA